MNFTKTILNGLKAWIENQLQLIENKITDIKGWADGVFVSHNPQTLTDTQKEQARTNIGIIAATDEDIINLLLDMDIMPVVQDTDGTVLVDSDNTIILT